MREELETSSWLQPETKRRALDKVNAMRVDIGYPSKWRSYADVRVSRSSYFENVRAAWMSGQEEEFERIGKPTDRTRWGMSPVAVNAYSNAGLVVVVFPAGILQPPLFDPDADDAANYGAIGAVIGHEIGHLFDDGGSKYDASGRLNNWWSNEDRSAFERRTECVVDQFNTIDAGGGLRHRGKQVLGEALGDLAGLKIAYKAYRRSLAGRPEPPPLDGFTADQRFFIAFARVWGTQFREEAKRLQVNANNHPLPQFRANATLQNMPEFHRAFGCKQGEPMVRPVAEQCSLW
jgi:endothelin-converting enzyme/putative endopeptidase